MGLGNIMCAISETVREVLETKGKSSPPEHVLEVKIESRCTVIILGHVRVTKGNRVNWGMFGSRQRRVKSKDPTN